MHYYARDLEAAAAAERRALALNPRLPLARVVLAKSLILQGKAQEAVTLCEATPAPRPLDVSLMLGIAQLRAGNRAAADAVLNDLNSRQPRPSAVLIQWHAATGSYDTAFALADNRSAALPAVLRIDPLFDGFRADPRFRDRSTAP